MSRIARRMMGTCLVVGLGCVGVSPARALAEQAAAKDMVEQRLQSLKETLTLTEAQQPQVRKVLEVHNARRQQLKEQLKQMVRQEADGIKAVLMPEQQGKFDQLMKEQAEQGQKVLKRLQEQGRGPSQ